MTFWEELTTLCHFHCDSQFWSEAQVKEENQDISLICTWYVSDTRINQPALRGVSVHKRKAMFFMTLKKTEAYEDAKFSAPFVFYKCSHLHVLFHATPKGMISLVQNYKILLSSFRVWLDLNHGLNGKIFIDFSGLWTNPHIPPAYAFPSMVLTENGVSFALAKKKKK